MNSMYICFYLFVSLASAANVTFDPDTLVMKEDTMETVNLTWPMKTGNVSHVMVTSSDIRIVNVRDVIVSIKSSNETYLKNISCYCDVTTVTVLVRALRLGRTELVFDIQLHSDSSLDYPKTSNNDLELNVTTDSNGTLSINYPVVVLRNVGMERSLNQIILHIMVGLLNFAFGCELDMEIILFYIKKPIPPGIGLCSQYLIMPLLGSLILYILRIDVGYGIGLLLLACSPGGIQSNCWSILLGGDVNLSLTMTFFSLVFAFGMMPLWLLIMSAIFRNFITMDIPYLNIIITLAEFVGPCMLGILLNRLKKELTKPFKTFLKPVAFLFLISLFSFVIYSNLYIFKLASDNSKVLLTGVFLPWCGFGFGFLFAFVLRQGLKRSITIAVETGIQNLAIGVLMLQKHFPQPEGDMAASVVLFAALFTPIPLFVAFVVLVIKRRCCGIVTKDRNVAVHFVAVAKDNVDEIFLKSDNVSPKKDISTHKDLPITLEEMD